MKTATTIWILILSTLHLSGQSCEVNGFSFSTFQDIVKILDDNGCQDCHSGTEKLGAWSYEDYEALTAPGACGQSPIIHGNASVSYLYEVLSGSDEICGVSSDHHQISSSDLDRIETWINQGAPELCLPIHMDIKVLFDDRGCDNCHGTQSAQWTYNSYSEMITPSPSGLCDDQIDLIIPQNAEGSLLYDKINNDGMVACGAEMQGSNQPLSAHDIAMVRDWINGGAVQNAETLPVELSLFEISKQDMTTVLDWTTAIEVATDQFVIERSHTGSTFVPIGAIPADGSLSGASYRFVDQQPAIGENYYRLRIEDLDGTYDYSNIRRLRLAPEKAQIIIAPNPVRISDRLRVIWQPTAGQEQAYLDIVDVNGSRLHRKVIFQGTNYVRLPEMVEGIYYIMVEDYFGSFLLERVVIID